MSVFRALALSLWACVFLVVGATARGDGDWTGTWEIAWSNGGGHLTLVQRGDSVTGIVTPIGSGIEGKVVGDRFEGSRFEGSRLEGARRHAMVLSRTRGGAALLGHDEIQGWISGTRVAPPAALPPVSLATPREAFANFVFSCTQDRCGLVEHLGQAAQSVEFDAVTLAEPRVAQLARVREFFDLVDLTTFHLWEVVDRDGAAEFVVPLRQARSEVVLPLKLRRDAAGEWRVVVPSQDEIAALRKSLFARDGGIPPGHKAHLQLKSARDCVRTFVEGMADWDGRGRALAISTLDLGELPDGLRDTAGNLAAGYLCRAFHRLGFVGLQGIPNDPLDRDPFVLFESSFGTIVVAPSGPEPNAPFKFDRATIASIARVEHETSGFAPARDAPPGVIPSTPYFAIREWVGMRAPALRARALGFEAWQFVALILAVVAAAAIAWIVSGPIAGRLTRAFAAASGTAQVGTRLSVACLVALVLLLPAPEYLGTPRWYVEVLGPVVETVAAVAVAILLWHGVGAACGYLMRFASRTESTGDDLAVSLLLGCLRLGVVVGAFLGIAAAWSIPGTHLLAGLGIGGVAIAFGSQNTISHFFGAGTIIADRPFGAGDWIQTPIASGVVERVGFRSTRVISADGTAVTVPNGALAGVSIVNLGKRRPRPMSVQVLVMQGATLEKVERFIAALRERLASDARFIPARTALGVSGIVSNGIQVQCNATLDVVTDQDEAEARHGFLVDLLACAEKEGLGLGPQFQFRDAKA
jgi:small-conductance mechanosensitive channel